MHHVLFSFENIYKAYLGCRKNKRNSKSALKFEEHAETSLLQLQKELIDRTYRPLPSICFVTDTPKIREIFAAQFRDRVVHHLIVRRLEPGWERRFIHDSYACRKGKGTHGAVERLRRFMRQVSANGVRRAWYLHIDIKFFFVSINKTILFDILSKKERDPALLWLLNQVLFTSPAHQPVILGPKSRLAHVPKHKSLFHAPLNTGLPIGNYTSQFFANVYLNELDQFVKHHLKCPYYIRYVDDLVLLDPDRRKLELWEDQIQAFLASRLHLSLNHRRRKLASVSSGCNFVGYVVRPSHVLIRQRSVRNFKKKVETIEIWVKQIFGKDNPVGVVGATPCGCPLEFGHLGTGATACGRPPQRAGTGACPYEGNPFRNGPERAGCPSRIQTF